MSTYFHTPSFGDEVIDLGDTHNILQETAAVLANNFTLQEETKGNQTNMRTEPSKPLSAYALFFRDTVTTIKAQNPECTYAELSRIVATLWEAQDEAGKQVYVQKEECEKADYLKQMRMYRKEQQQQQETAAETSNSSTSYNSDNDDAANTAAQTTAQDEVDSNQESSNIDAAPADNSSTSENNACEQIQMLSEAGSAQLCTREGCSKRAIINPDWEDEYCSNECVVLHCRVVFNAWVQSNLDAAGA